MQALLRAPCPLDHERIQVALTAGELVADLRAQPPGPGRLDQQPTNVLVPALVIDPRRWDSSEECSVGTRPTNAMNRLGGPKPRELADLADDPERGQRVDAAHAAQLRDQPSPRPVRGCLIERALERLDPPVEQTDRVQVVRERLLLGGEREPLV